MSVTVDKLRQKINELSKQIDGISIQLECAREQRKRLIEKVALVRMRRRFESQITGMGGRELSMKLDALSVLLGE